MFNDSKKPLLVLVGLYTLLQSWNVYPGAENPIYSPYSEQTFPTTVYWGDTHVHTNMSPDAYTFGAKLGPDAAYRFATGETIVSNTGQQVKLSSPLDFILISDHGAFLGVFPMLDIKDEALARTPLGKRWLAMYDQGRQKEVVIEFIDAIAGKNEEGLAVDEDIQRSVWQRVTAMADTYNDPGRFTAFIGYEWTSMPEGRNLHRNILFKDDASFTNQIVPLTTLDTMNPEELWEFLDDYERNTGGRALAIPHNGNVSNGLMFSDKTFAGEPLAPEYAETRRRWEPIVEVTQYKGDGETHPYLSPDDEFADYETWDAGNMAIEVVPKEPWMLKHEYARSALRLGLELDNSLGSNPYAFGMVGSTDSHTGLAAAEENNYFGKFAQDEPAANRTSVGLFEGEIATGPTYAASGYAAVWATQNTRDDLFDAIQRKEVYATTGSRILVRFFGGWDYEESDDKRPDFVDTAYARGVPMGGELSPGEGAAPRFLVFASKDPRGANLDRIQIVKGWLNEDGTTSEKVYNVAASDRRQIIDNRLPPLEHTVDVENATYLNTIGASQLSTVWEDPDFNAELGAFYYARVLEIPTPHWSAYDTAFYGSKPGDRYKPIHQERAYTSPIWYSP